MKPHDKHGHALWGETWDRVFHYGTQLLALGYREHHREDNLFVRRYAAIEFYADLRGTDIVDIWRDRRPVFWWRLPKDLDLATTVRAVGIEAARTAPVPLRISHRPSPESLEVLVQVDRRHFERAEPAHVPKAPVLEGPPPPVVPIERLGLLEALDPRTGELVTASGPAAARPHLRCRDCNAPLTRRWDAGNQRYYFPHPGGPCARASL